MDQLLIVNIMLNSALIAVLLFGAYLVYAQIVKSKSNVLFIAVMIIFSVSLLFDSYDQIMRTADGEYDISPLNYNSLLTGVLSQPILLLLFYSLLFSMRRSLEIVAIQCVVLFIPFVAIWSIDSLDPAHSMDDNFSSIGEMIANAASPLVYLRFVVMFLQVIMSLMTMVVSYKLVPLYQRYIEQWESNVAYNILWVREVGIMTVLITAVYTIDMIFLSAASSIIYYIVVIVAFARMINVFLQHKTLDNYSKLYRRIGIKWSARRLWYVEEVKHDTPIHAEYMYNLVVNWITAQKPYVQVDFSFNDVTREFPLVKYNYFDDIIKAKRNQSFQAYIRDLRICEAVKLMDNGYNSSSFKEISFRVGFENSSSFARAFKAVKGVTPSEWRAGRD